MKLFVIFVALCLVACAGTITGSYGNSTVSAFNPQTIAGFGITNGTYTISTEDIGSIQAGGCIPQPLDGSTTGIWYGPCSYTPSGSFSSSTNPLIFHRITVSGPGISGSFGPGASQTGTPFTLTLTFTFSGPSVILQPSRTDFTSFFNVGTSSTNLPVDVRGTVNLVVGGNCVWCEAFSGSGVSSGSLTGDGSVSFNPYIIASFSAETVPEPSTWAMAVSGVSLLALLRTRRQSCCNLA